MKKRTFERVDEKLFIEKLDNGLEVYLYNTKKTKNFYISISVKYGAKTNSYKLNNEKYNIINGSAHFLEHKVMALSENTEISKRINDLGSLANAWTSYIGTNYNIFGSINLIENLKLLLDIFYKIDINDKSVEEEKGIICEEIDMEKDNITSMMYNTLYKNLFNSSYIRNTIIGEHSDIEKITSKDLNRIYNDFYVPNNTFILVLGDFDNEQVLETIKSYMQIHNINRKTIPKTIKTIEKDYIPIKYDEIKKDTEDTRILYSLKINKKIFGIKDDNLLLYYLLIIFNCNLSATSLLYEKYKNNNIMIDMSYNISIIDDYIAFCIHAFANDGDNFIKNIEKDINKLNITKTEFNRKKKSYLKKYVMSFENIEDIEYSICYRLFLNNKLDFKEYSLIESMSYDEARRIIKLINTNNISIVKVSK
ncbi:MAG: insulinase family protein [Tenericutes bacterium]|nr:insulinase family protein [Mycoplasmatota bacterium]